MKIKFENFINEAMHSKSKIEKNFIDAWKPIFDYYPELKAIPVYGWGRYYKYEMAGNPFEKFVDESGFNGFRHMDIPVKFQWELLKEIDKKHNIEGGEMWNGEWGDYSPSRDDVVKAYQFDSRGGQCLVIEKNGDNLVINCYDCGSPE